MSKRAEEAALKAYPVYGKWVGNQYGYWDNDINSTLRKAYLQGYEQAEKDTLRKVEKWLAEIHRVCDITDENGYRIELRDLTALLEKAMEKE